MYTNVTWYPSENDATILSWSLVMRGVDVLLFCQVWRADLESEWMMNLEDL